VLGLDKENYKNLYAVASFFLFPPEQAQAQPLRGVDPTFWGRERNLLGDSQGQALTFGSISFLSFLTVTNLISLLLLVFILVTVEREEEEIVCLSTYKSFLFFFYYS